MWNILDIVSIWVGRIVIAAIFLWIAWELLRILKLSIRDTSIWVLNVFDLKNDWRKTWFFIALPIAFCHLFWDQIKARWIGYDVYLERGRVNF